MELIEFQESLAGGCTCSFANSKPQANGGVAEGHDRSQNRQKPQAVKVGNLTQHQLESAKNKHEGVVVHLHGQQDLMSLIACSTMQTVYALPA